MTNIKEQILNFDIHVSGDTSIFVSKLMSDNRWSKRFALLALKEYKKFLYLMVVSNERLSPSRVIDNVWHCHLTFTQSYWHELCRDLLKREIHHVPSPKDSLNQTRDADAYERTLSQYRIYFGEPEITIWGKGNTQPQKIGWVPVVFFSAFLTACSLGSDTDVGTLLLWVLAIYVVYRIVKWIIKSGGGGTGGGCGSSCSSGCGGD